MLCRSCNKTTMAKEKKKRRTKSLRQKHGAAVLPQAVMTYRLVAAHTPPPEPLFPQHSSAGWWSHRGGIWPGWCHSLLWCSHPHPTDHFCKTKSRFSGALLPMGQSDRISHFAIMDKLQAQKDDTAGSLPPSMRLVLRAGVQLRVDETLRDPSHSCRLYAFQALYCICCYLWFFSLSLYLFYF